MEVPPPASRSFLCRALGPFPRVFAAEPVTADSEALAERQWPPTVVPEPCYPESGWDRLRELFLKDNVHIVLPHEASFGMAGAGVGELQCL
uniref:Translocase of inner mitochondrial membrane domain containing 1 n=1 Tax=Cebus imitator TaxID=2715852 RepID=A0A2K5RF77_CEBIM